MLPMQTVDFMDLFIIQAFTLYIVPISNLFTKIFINIRFLYFHSQFY